MNTKLILQKQNKTIFIFKLKKSKNSGWGEVDIMIDTGKNLHFQQVVAGNYFCHFRFPEEKINGISWHGYYEKSGERSLLTPIIHFKNGKARVREAWHFGSINKEEPFAFPVCSIYIPKEIDLRGVNTSDYKGATHFIRNVDYDVDKRIDIFVTPREFSAQKIVESLIGYVYKSSDIDMFNRNDGFDKKIKESDDKKENYLEIVETDSGHDIIIRTVGNQTPERLFSSLEGSFSLVLHEPNDTYKRITERPVVEYFDGINVSSSYGLLKKSELLRMKYEQEVDLLRK